MVDVKPVRSKNEERIAIALGMQQSAERSRDKAEKGLRAAQADNVRLREQLSEAKAELLETHTYARDLEDRLAKVREWAETYAFGDGDYYRGIDAAQESIKDILSAPSSTGGGEKPKTVCLCGSTRFRAEIAEANRSLTMQGYMVLAPGVFGHDGDPLTDDDKMRLDKLHFSKIDASDRVHVVNPGGYIGESTRREIEYAKAKGKPVTYRHESSTGGNFRDDLKSRESRRSDVDFDTATNRPLGGDDHE